MTRGRVGIALGLIMAGTALFLFLSSTAKPEENIELSVIAENGGTVDELPPDSYEPNTQITIRAAADSGYRFDRWTTSTGGYFEDKFSASTAFTVPEQSAVVIAHFVPTEDTSPLYYLTVTNGDGGGAPAGLATTISGFYKQGAKITVPLRSMPGYIFSKWITSDGGYFEDEYNFESAFIMPGNPTTITATFIHKPLFQKRK